MHGFLYLILGFKRGISEKITGDLRYLRAGSVLRLQHIQHPDGGCMHSDVSTGGLCSYEFFLWRRI
jgi:hypothetical protein